MPNNFDKLFNQAQGNELINALKGIKSSLDVNYPLETVNVTLSNNAQNITPSENYYGLGQVNVPGMNLSDMTILVNGNYDPVTSGLDGYGKLNVNVPTWGQADEGKVVSNNALVPQTNREVNANGTYDTTLNNSVLVNVPNTFGPSDEGKVVMNNALVPQTNRSITQNGTYDTTTNNEVVINVEGGGSGGSKNILGGTTNPTSADGTDGDIYIKYTVYNDFIEGYTALEYLGVGDTAGPYIDTGVANTSTAYFEVDAQWTALPSNNDSIFGAQTSSEYTINAWQGTAFVSAGVHAILGTPLNRHRCKADSNGIYIDGSLSATPNWNNATNRNYYLFANNYSGGVLKGSGINIYGVKLWNGDTLVRDFVPAKRNSDDALGMYDLVNDVFYTNSGTGSFIGGSELTGTPIDTVYLKVNGSWGILEDGDWSEVNTQGNLTTKTITQNGTYSATDDNADGYSEVVVNVEGSGGSYYPWLDATYDGTLQGYMPTVYHTNTKGEDFVPASSHIEQAVSSGFSYDIYNLNTGKNSLSSATIAITQDKAILSVADFIKMWKWDVVAKEYKGHIYNTSKIADLGLVLLGDFSQGGSASGNVLNDSIANYTGVILQGIYRTDKTVSYDTSILYQDIVLGQEYWAGMKDRNTTYDCLVTFTDNTHCDLSGNLQVIIYGIL